MPSATVLAGPWETLYIGYWNAVEISADPYSKFSQLLVGIRAVFTFDVAVRHANAWTKFTSVA